MFTVIDLGASGSRYTTDGGKIYELANNMVTIPNAELTSIVPYDDNTIEESLEVFISKGGSSKYFPVHILSGNMATRFSSNNDRPSVNNHKYRQAINYIQAILIAAVAKIKVNDSSDVKLYIATPPVETLEAQKAFGEELSGQFTVRFPKYKGGVEVNVNNKSVHCCEESVMACTSFFFNMNGKIREEAKAFLTGTVLSLDIGASTTDLAIVKNGKFLERSGQTYKTGGNVVRDFVMEHVTSTYGFDPDQEMADTAVIEGRLQLGNGYVEIGEVVSQAKRELARGLTKNMETYFKRINIPIQSIRAIMVSGGGSKQSQYVSELGEVIKTSDPMSEFVTAELQEWSPNTVVVNYGDDARLANVKGLFIRAKFDEMKEAQNNAARNAAGATPVQPVQMNNQVRAAGTTVSGQATTA